MADPGGRVYVPGFRTSPSIDTGTIHGPPWACAPDGVARIAAIPAIRKRAQDSVRTEVGSPRFRDIPRSISRDGRPASPGLPAGSRPGFQPHGFYGILLWLTSCNSGGSRMNVAIVGTGYVGLVTGVCLAERGNTVHCVDNNPRIVERLNGGEVTIYEPGLEEIYARNLRKGRIIFSGDLEKAALAAELIFLCLPTPPGEDGSADLKYILRVADDLGKIFSRNPNAGYKVVVDKSTVPVGTSEKVQAAIRKHAGAAYGFDVVS